MLRQCAMQQPRTKLGTGRASERERASEPGNPFGIKCRDFQELGFSGAIPHAPFRILTSWRPPGNPSARRRETAARDLRARELVLLVYNTIYQLEGGFKIKSRLG